MKKIIKIFREANERFGLRILSINDIVKFSKLTLTPAIINVYINRALKNEAGQIQRIATGFYALKYVSWTWRDLLDKLSGESYLSGLYVLSAAGLYLGQPVIEGVTSSINKNKNIMTAKGKLTLYRDFNFSVDGVDLDTRIACTEKAIADYIRIRQNAGESFDRMFNKGLWNFALLKKINIKKALRYSADPDIVRCLKV